MATIPLPALDLRPPQQPSFLDDYARVMQIKNLQTQGQAQQLGLQQAQLAMADDQKWRSVIAQSADHPEWGTEDILNAGLKAGVGPQSYFAMQQGLTEHQQALTKLGSDQLGLYNGVTDKIQGLLQDVYDAPADQKLEAQQQAKAKAVNLIQNTPGLAPQVRQQMLGQSEQIPDDQYIGDDRLALMLGSHNLYSTIASRALQAAQTQEAAGKGAQAGTEAQLNQIKLRLANAQPGAFDSQIDSVIPAAQFGQLNSSTKAMVNSSLARGDVDSARQTLDRAFGTVSDISKETNPAVAQSRAQQAAMTAQIVEPLRQQVLSTFQNNKDARDKIETSVLAPYQQKMSEIAELNATLDQAAGGNVASARAALLKMMGVANPDGTKRYNAQEASRMASMGSIPQRMQGTVQNALTGNEWTSQMISDMRSFALGQAAAAQQSLNSGIDNTNRLYGTNVGAGLKQTGIAGLPQGAGRLIDKATALQFYSAAGNDPDKARQMAMQNGWKVQ